MSDAEDKRAKEVSDAVNVIAADSPAITNLIRKSFQREMQEHTPPTPAEEAQGARRTVDTLMAAIEIDSKSYAKIPGQKQPVPLPEDMVKAIVTIAKGKEVDGQALTEQDVRNLVSGIIKGDSDARDKLATALQAGLEDATKPDLAAKPPAPVVEIPQPQASIFIPLGPKIENAITELEKYGFMAPNLIDGKRTIEYVNGEGDVKGHGTGDLARVLAIDIDRHIGFGKVPASDLEKYTNAVADLSGLNRGEIQQIFKDIPAGYKEMQDSTALKKIMDDKDTPDAAKMEHIRQQIPGAFEDIQKATKSGLTLNQAADKEETQLMQDGRKLDSTAETKLNTAIQATIDASPAGHFTPANTPAVKGNSDQPAPPPR